jgi:hypothetical protein
MGQAGNQIDIDVVDAGGAQACDVGEGLLRRMQPAD